MRYRDFIEENFLIDEPKSGGLVPFVFNPVQAKEYELLKTDYGIEEHGIGSPARELVLKARREGFTSLFLALFAADMILNPDPTKAAEISYKDEATKEHFKRYRMFLQSYYARKSGLKDIKDIQNFDLSPFVETDNKHEIILKENKAAFYVGTASAKVGGRGGTLQKLLFTEAAFYPNTDIMTASEILNATMRQVDIAAGWIMIESTGKRGTEYERMWEEAELGRSRFRHRFFGWRDFYTEDELKVIRGEFTDELKFKQEYPETPKDAFASTSDSFTVKAKLDQLIARTDTKKRIGGWMRMKGRNYIDQAEIIKAFLLTLEQRHPNRDIFVGIDVAKQTDETVLTYLVEEGFGVGQVHCVAIDSTGVGDFLPDWFERNGRWYVLRVRITAQQNDAMYKLLQQVIENKLTSLPRPDGQPDYPDFESQILGLIMDRKGDLLVVGAPNGKHDDFADSWALAEFGYATIRGFPQSNTPVQGKKVLGSGLSHLLTKSENPQSEDANDSYA